MGRSLILRFLIFLGTVSDSEWCHKHSLALFLSGICLLRVCPVRESEDLLFIFVSVACSQKKKSKCKIVKKKKKKEVREESCSFFGA